MEGLTGIGIKMGVTYVIDKLIHIKDQPVLESDAKIYRYYCAHRLQWPEHLLCKVSQPLHYAGYLGLASVPLWVSPELQEVLSVAAIFLVAVGSFCQKHQDFSWNIYRLSKDCEEDRFELENQDLFIGLQIYDKVQAFGAWTMSSQ